MTRPWMGMTMTDERAAFDQLYRSAHPEVLAYCLRRLPRPRAEEAADEVFATLWRRRAELPPAEEILAFTYGVARNVVSTHLRSDRRWGRLTAKVAGLGSSVPPVDDVVVMREEHRTVLRALADLSEADREILRLSAWEGLSNREVAVALGISADAADQRLSRAKRRLAHSYRHAETERGHS